MYFTGKNGDRNLKFSVDADSGWVKLNFSSGGRWWVDREEVEQETAKPFKAL